jgi:predicted membrane protein
VSRQRKTPGLIWGLVLIVALGMATSALFGDNDELMKPQQAGIIVQ